MKEQRQLTYGDIITNQGTTEHIEPFESQYECFSILHDCVKVGGIIVHLLPDVYEHDEHGRRKNHCPFYYSESFFEMLAKECEYELLSNTVINGLRCAVVRKKKSVPFMHDRSKFLALISQRKVSIFHNNPIRTILRQMGVGKLIRRLGLKRLFRTLFS